MAKIILIKNPLTGDKIEHMTTCRQLADAVLELVSTFPELIPLVESKNVGVRINGLAYPQSVLERLSICELDTVVIFPSIEEPVSISAMITAAASAATASAGGATVAGAAAAGAASTAAGMTAGGVVVGSVASTVGVATAAAAYAGAIVGTLSLGTLGTIGTLASLGMSMYSAFSAQKPAVASGDGSPGEGSPTYGWSVEPTASEGIPIPIIYGTNKIGGNVISQATESVPCLANDWFTSKDEGCGFMIGVVDTVPGVNLIFAGMYPPIKGISMELDKACWFYGFVTLNIINWNRIKKILHFILETVLTKPLATTVVLTIVFTIINAALREIFTSGAWRLWISAWTGIDIPNFNFGGLRVTDLPFTNHETMVRARRNRTYFGKYWDYFDNDNQRNLVVDFINGELEGHIADLKSKVAAGADWLSQYITVSFQGVNQNGGMYTKVFETGTTKQDDLGLYLVSVFPIGQIWEAIQHPQCWVSDVECLSTVLSDDTLFGLPLPELDKSWDNRLHQVIALGEGPIDGVERVFLNDTPIYDYPAANAFFRPGLNLRNAALNTKEGEVGFDYFQRLTGSHSRSEELDEIGDFAEFITSEDFPANNVMVRCSFTAHRTTKKGKTSDLGDHPIRFIVVMGLNEVADFNGFHNAFTGAGRNWNPLIAETYKVACWDYSIKGGITEPIYRQYAGFPIVDLFKKGIDYFTTYFPGGLRVVCALFNVQDTDYSDNRINWALYYNWSGLYDDDTVEAYKAKIWGLLQERVNGVSLRNTHRLVCRIYRTSTPYDNNRYQDKMTVVGFDEVSYTGYEYPNTAILGIAARATGALSGSPPTVTSIVRGRTLSLPILKLKTRPPGATEDVRVFYEHAWFDEDIGRYRSMMHDGAECIYHRVNGNLVWSNGTPSVYVGETVPFAQDLRYEYCNNPVWCLYDLMTNDRYGLGNHINRYDIQHNLETWLRAAEYCDTMVPDGVQRKAVNMTSTYLRDTNIDLFAYDVRRNVGDEENGLLETTDISTALTNYTSDLQHYKTKILNKGRCIFAKKADGTWTKTYASAFTPGPLNSTFTFGPYTKAGSPPSNWTNGNPVLTDFYYQFGEKRYMLDLVMDEQCNAVDYIKQICDTFRAFPIWINGCITPIIDMPTEPVCVIGEGNIIKDSLNISYNSLQQVSNVVECQFSNQNNFYEKDTREYIDPEIDVVNMSDTKQAIRKQSIKLLGITRESQIYRELFYRMMSTKLQPRTIQFRMGPEAMLLHAGDVFDFAHRIVLNTGKSGRVLHVTMGATLGQVVIDQDLETRPDIITMTCVVKEYNADGTETGYASEESVTFTVDSSCPATGNVVIIQVQDTAHTPEAWLSYSLGEENKTTIRCRAMKVTPAAGGEVEIVAGEFNAGIHGAAERLPFNPTLCPWSVIRYNDMTYQYKNNSYNPFPSMTDKKPLQDLAVTNDAEPKLKITFRKPEGVLGNTPLLYNHARVTVEGDDGTIKTYSVQESADPQVLWTDKVDPDVNYFISAFAIYGRDDSTAPWSFALTKTYRVNDNLSIPTLPPLPAITGIRVAPIARGRWHMGALPIVDGHEVDYTQCFCTKHIPIKWDKVAYDETQLGAGVNLKDVQYHLHFKYMLNGVLVDSATIVTHDFNHNYHTIDPGEDLGIENKSVLKNVSEVRVYIHATAAGRTGLDGVQRLFPNPFFKAQRIFVTPIFFGVMVHWLKEPGWEDVDQYQVTVTAHERAGTGRTVTICPSTVSDGISNDRTFFAPITPAMREEMLDFPNLPLGLVLNWRFTATVVPVTAYKTQMASTGTGDDDQDGGSSGDTDEQLVPPWAISPLAYSISLFDSANTFISIPPRTYASTIHTAPTAWNPEYRSGALTNLTDPELASGCTWYNIPALQCLRIMYNTGADREYTRFSITVDRECDLWLEFLERDDDNNYKATWDYFGGDSSDALVSGYMTGYNLNANAALHPVHLSAGSYPATFNMSFPRTIRTSYMRVILDGMSGNDITVSNIRFAYFLHVDYLSAIAANMGTLTAGSIRFNCPEELELPAGTLDAPLPTPTTGAMRLNSTGLTMWNHSGERTCQLNTETGAFSLGGGAPHEVTGDLRIAAGGSITIAAGGSLDLEGSIINITSGGELNIQADGALNIEAGNSHWFGGIIHIHSGGPGGHTNDRGIYILPETGTIQSANFSAGTFGQGYQFKEDGNITAMNLDMRGTIRCSVFEKGSITSVAGEIYVPEKAALLAADVPAYPGWGYGEMIFPTGAFTSGEIVFAKDLNVAGNVVQEAVTIDSRVSYSGESNEYEVWRVWRNASLGWTPSVLSGEAWVKGTTFQKCSSAVAGSHTGSINLSAGNGLTTKAHIVLMDAEQYDSPYTATKKVVVGDLSVAPTTYFGPITGNGLYAENAYIAGRVYLAAGNDVVLRAGVGGAEVKWIHSTDPDITLASIHAFDTEFHINYDGTNGANVIKGTSDGLSLEYLSLGGGYTAKLSLSTNSVALNCRYWYTNVTNNGVTIGNWDGATWREIFNCTYITTYGPELKLSWFGVTPVVRQTMSIVSHQVTLADAIGIYSADEMNLINDLKAKLNSLDEYVGWMVDRLQAYGLF